MFENQILETGLTRTPNYTGITPRDRFYIGYIGELAFEQLLMQHGKRFEYCPRCDGIPDESDFILFSRAGSRATVNVKTAGKPFHSRIMIPEAQFQRHQQDIYIAARIEDARNVSFHGWIRHRELAQFPPERVLILTRCCYFFALHPMDVLINHLQNIYPFS